MLRANIKKTPRYVLEKLDYLHNLLQEVKKKYEDVATYIRDKQLQRTVISLAQESNQYASELASMIKTLGGEMIHSSDYAKIVRQPEHSSSTNILDYEKEILGICAACEKKMISAYREILNEPYLYEGIRNLIRSQFNGVLCAFLQVKLLSSSLQARN